MGLSSIAVTPGSGANIVIYTDGGGNDHPVGVMEILVSGTPTPVSAAAPLPANVAQVGGAALALGQAVKAASLPVALASDQGNLNVALAAALPAGANLVGQVELTDGTHVASVNAGGALLTSPQSQPARSRTVDTIAAAAATDALMNGTTALTPQFASISCAAAGDNTILAAVAGKTIRVLEYVLNVAGAVTVKFTSGAAGTALSGAMALAANGGIGGAFCPVGLFQALAPNTALVLNLSAAVQVSGHLVYVAY